VFGEAARDDGNMEGSDAPGQREAPTRGSTGITERTARSVLVTVVVAGTLLRFAFLTFGFPSSWHPDEGPAAKTVADCYRGHATEHRFRHPALLLNLACQAERALTPLVRRAPIWLPVDVLLLRTVSAAAGSATIVFVYLLAGRLVGREAALGAAFLFAIFPAAVVTSRYGTPDSLLTMLIVLSLWLQVKMAMCDKGEEAGASFAAALATTLAFAAKYNAGFLAISFAAALLAGARRRSGRLFETRALLACAAAIAIGIAIGFPKATFGGQLPQVVAGIGSEGRHLTAAGHYGMTLGAAEGGFVFHFRYSILPATGVLLLAAMVGGLVALGLVLASEGSVAALVLLAFAVPYYVVVETIYKVPPSYERYALPLVPVYVVATALLVERLVSGLRARGVVPQRFAAALPALVFLVLGASSLRKTIEVTSGMQHDTRVAMAKWLRTNVSDHEAIAAAWPMLRYYYPNGALLKPLSPRVFESSRTSVRYILVSSLVYERYLDFPDEDPKWTRLYQRLFSGSVHLVHAEDAGDARYMFHNPTLRLYRIGKEDEAG
jgi:hypothetical protein